MRGDLGPERVPTAKLRYRYNQEKILKEIAANLEESSRIALAQAKKGEIPKIYCTLGFPVPKEDPKILGDLPLKAYEAPLKTVQATSLLPRWEKEDSSISYFTFYATPYCKEDILTTLELLLDNERIHHLAYIWEEDGILHFSRNFKTGEGKVSWIAIHRKKIKKEKFKPLFKSYYDFLPYYLSVIDVMGKMYRKELYENTNLALSRISEGLVWTRRTKDGKDIRVNSPSELLDLVSWGAFEFFLENNKCLLKETNCRNCEKNCWPNVIFDIDPGLKVSEEKLFTVLNIIHKNLEEEGVNYITKFTGKRGYHITAYFDSLKLPEKNYIPLRLLRHAEEMSTKQLKQALEKISKDPFEVVRDFIRCKTEYWKIVGNIDYLVHDFSTFDGVEYVKVDASSVKRRGYHRTYYSLTPKGTACLPFCQNGVKLDKKLLEKVKEMSANPWEILKYEKELMDIQIDYNDPSYVKDFLEENERKIFKKHFEKVEKRLSL
jgi:Txe/YoeB family toxin of Txe-Axe toxin-antitoxin module